MYSYVIDVLLP